MELIKARTLDASNGIHAERRLDVEFVFYVKHQALLYLVNKAVFSGRICIWFLLLKDLDSSIVTRPLRSDVAAYHKLNPNFPLTDKIHSCTNWGPQSHYSTTPRNSTKKFH